MVINTCGRYLHESKDSLIIHSGVETSEAENANAWSTFLSKFFWKITHQDETLNSSII